MLILTRKIKERILIGDDITITVCAVKGEQVKIGVEAPRDKNVDREEIRKRRNAGSSNKNDKRNAA